MTLEQWIIAVAATWYMAYAVTKTHGPFGIFERLREFKGGRWHGRTYHLASSQEDGRPIEYTPVKMSNGLLDCIICLMPWLALVVIYLQTGRVLLLEALAVAGVALWIHGYTNWVHIK